MRAGIVMFPGSNCDRDMFHVLDDVFGFDTMYIWHEYNIPDVDVLVLPGGFSYGDHLRAGAIASHSPIINNVKQMADSGQPILGVCNGFQILVESGILPGTLQRNSSLEFMCKWTNLIVQNNQTPFTSKMELNQSIQIPIANGEGRYYADDETLKKLQNNNQIVFTYSQQINDSSLDIAGICNEAKNVVGMMPHPERAAESILNPNNSNTSSLIFESLLDFTGVT